VRAPPEEDGTQGDQCARRRRGSGQSRRAHCAEERLERTASTRRTRGRRAAGDGRRRWERGAGSLFFKSFFSFLQIRVLNLFIQVSQNVSIYTLPVKSPSPLSLYLFLLISKVPNIFPRNFGVIQQQHQKVDQNLYNEN